MTSLDYDFVEDDADPLPANPLLNHGTQVAGTIAMGKDDSICGVGVAYQSTVTGRETTVHAP